MSRGIAWGVAPFWSKGWVFDLLTPEFKRDFPGGVMADADELVEAEEKWPESWK